MPRGSGLYSQLMEKRRALEKAISDIDAVIRIVRTEKLAGSRRGKPMSVEHKRKISEAAKRRHARERKDTHKDTHKPKAINRPIAKAAAAGA